MALYEGHNRYYLVTYHIDAPEDHIVQSHSLIAETYTIESPNAHYRIRAAQHFIENFKRQPNTWKIIDEQLERFLPETEYIHDFIDEIPIGFGSGFYTSSNNLNLVEYYEAVDNAYFVQEMFTWVIKYNAECIIPYIIEKLDCEEDVRTALLQVAKNLHPRPIVQNHELGTSLPNDPHYVIDSYSDVFLASVYGILPSRDDWDILVSRAKPLDIYVDWSMEHFLHVLFHHWTVLGTEWMPKRFEFLCEYTLE